MNFYQNPAPTPFVTVGNTGLRQPQLQQSIKSHLSQEQYIAELENRLRALWDKYDGDRKHYMDRIKRLEEAGDAVAAIIGPPGSAHWADEDQVDSAWNNWTKAKEAE